MIKAVNHPLFTPLMRFYIDNRIKRNFRTLVLEGEYMPSEEESVMLLSNHTGWWDGFWIEQLVRHRFKRDLRVMVDYNSLSQHKVLRYMGAYGAPRGIHEQNEQLVYTLYELQNPKNCLLLFPQGSLYSLYEDEIRFRRGADYFIKQTPVPPCVLFIYLLVEYGSYSRPSAFVYYERYNPEISATDSLQDAYGLFRERIAENHKLKMNNL